MKEDSLFLNMLEAIILGETDKERLEDIEYHLKKHPIKNFVKKVEITEEKPTAPIMMPHGTDSQATYKNVGNAIPTPPSVEPN